MKRVVILIIMIILLNAVSLSFAKEVSFTHEDRDRLIKLETMVVEGFKAINQRIDDTNRRIDDLRDLIYVVLGGMIALIGFVIWDRRSALAPAIRKNKELEEQGERLERALRELATKDPRVAEALKHVRAFVGGLQRWHMDCVSQFN